MKVLLDTHFVIWITTGHERLAGFPWLERYQPWGVSPVTLLEVQYLSEVGRLQVENPAFTEAVSSDPRFIVDDPSFAGLVRQALGADWTRDPFDRLLAAHSQVRRAPLCTVDRVVRSHHSLLVPELAG